ncbi:MAG: hypothetical protein KDA60_10985 [Planctomycetales bacterium]|nr:hypothetical protein [Planctomycetales bacterium]
MNPLIDLLKKDRRYPFEAYQFVRESLAFAQKELEMGCAEEEAATEEERHLTGQELCEAIRQYAVLQFGYMAQVVLKNWGITTTGDFGEIVYNLIGIDMMKKSKTDRREDFDDVYDFEEVFRRQFVITPPE